MNAPLTLPRHKLTIEDYHQMGRAGILHEDNRVELLEGELIDMAPIGSLHSGVVNKLSALLGQQSQGKAIVSAQNPLSLPPHNEPQPDLMLLKPRKDWYYNALPVPEDVLLLIEIADTTIERDRTFKCPLYARHGIPEVWLIDLQERVVEIYQEPSPRGYRKLLRREKGDTVSPAFLPDVQFSLAEIWPA